MSDSRDVIQARLLSNIDNSYNKSEGEFLYDVEKPISIELESAYTTLDGLLDKTFVDTATGKNLDRIVASVGLIRKETTQASETVKITGISGSTINKGDSVSSDGLTFTFTDTSIVPANGIAYVNVRCTSYGSVGNVPVGAIKYFPRTLAGLQTVTNLEKFTNGYDEETDDSLRARYFTKVQAPSTSGNKYDYLNWSKSVTGVGDAKIIPLWNGAGSVKVIIINNNYKGADSTLVNSVAEYIEEERPIGATVTVVSATELNINITVTIQIDSTATTQAQALANIENTLTEYLASIAFKQDYVSYAKVGSLILSVSGIKDYSNLLINGVAGNVTIGNEQVAVLGGVTLG